MSGIDIAALRRMVSSIHGNRPHGDEPAARSFTLGMQEAGRGMQEPDRAFPDGLARDAVHEIFAQNGGAASAASGFALGLFLRASSLNRPLVWLEEDSSHAEHGGLYPPGLAALGFDPARLLMVRCSGAKDVLKGAADALETGKGAIGGIVATLMGAPKCLDLTASRRLQLGSRNANLPVFLLRFGAPASNSASATRWQIAAGPSRSSGAQAPGKPTFDVTLERNRHGGTGRWIMEWDNEQTGFTHVTPFSGAVVSTPADRQIASRRSPLRQS